MKVRTKSIPALLFATANHGSDFLHRARQARIVFNVSVMNGNISC
jgi:hypothetical protein